MPKCETCGAPVTLVPDGDPAYNPMPQALACVRAHESGARKMQLRVVQMLHQMAADRGAKSADHRNRGNERAADCEEHADLWLERAADKIAALEPVEPQREADAEEGSDG